VVDFDYFEVWNTTEDLSKINKNVAKIEVALEGNPEDKFFKISPYNYKKIEIFQRLENSISIMDEGPHCDLINWKHYTSDWVQIPYNRDDNLFKTITYSQVEKNKFIPIEMDDLKQAVKEHCDERWADLIKDATSLSPQHHISISPSRIFLKIILTNNEGKVTEKIIEFSIPMGC